MFTHMVCRCLEDIFFFFFFFFFLFAFREGHSVLCRTDIL